MVVGLPDSRKFVGLTGVKQTLLSFPVILWTRTIPSMLHPLLLCTENDQETCMDLHHRSSHLINAQDSRRHCVNDEINCGHQSEVIYNKHWRGSNSNWSPVIDSTIDQ